MAEAAEMTVAIQAGSRQPLCRCIHPKHGTRVAKHIPPSLAPPNNPPNPSPRHHSARHTRPSHAHPASKVAPLQSLRHGTDTTGQPTAAALIGWVPVAAGDEM